MDIAGPRQRGLALVTFGALLVVVAFGGSWAVAADTTTVTSDADENARTLVGVQGPARGGNVTMLDGQGQTVWSLDGSISYQGVTYLDDGRVLATFADYGYRRCGQFTSPCKRTGVRIVEPDPEPHVVSEWSYPVRTREDSEVHDAELLPSGELLVADMEYESIFVVNRSTGERRWTWNASERYDAPPDPTETDWLHINDVDRIGDGRYLVSVRNTNQLLVIERGEGVVEVINEDRDPDVLNKQHNPQWLGDGRVLVADSENHRIVELHRTDDGDWEVAWSLSGANGIPFDWPRDADRLPNGNTLITDSRNDRVVEVDRNGTLVASYATPPLPYEADRLPVGEAVGRPADSSGTSTDVNTEGADEGLRIRIPVLSSALAAANHVVQVPYWVTELHVLAALLALGCWVWGGRLLVVGTSRTRQA